MNRAVTSCAMVLLAGISVAQVAVHWDYPAQTSLPSPAPVRFARGTTEANTGPAVAAATSLPQQLLPTAPSERDARAVRQAAVVAAVPRMPDGLPPPPRNSDVPQQPVSAPYVSGQSVSGPSSVRQAVKPALVSIGDGPAPAEVVVPSEQPPPAPAVAPARAAAPRDNGAPMVQPRASRLEHVTARGSLTRGAAKGLQAKSSTKSGKRMQVAQRPATGGVGNDPQTLRTGPAGRRTPQPRIQ